MATRRFIPWVVSGALAAGLAAAGVWVWSTGEALPEGFAIGNGRLEAEEIHIATKLGGRIIEVAADEGDPVDAGQVVARLDCEALQADLAAADAETLESVEEHRASAALVERAKHQCELARREYQRAQELFAAHVIAEGQLDRRQTELRSAEADCEATLSQLARAEQGIERSAARAYRLRVDIGECSLVSPRAGRVQYRLAEPGEVLAPGGRVLTVIDLEDMYMTLFLPAQQAGRVAIGADARIVLDALPEAPIPARVTFVSAKAQFTPKQVETASERQSLSFRVKVHVLDGTNPRLHPGTPGVAYIRLDDDSDWPERLQ